MDDKKFIIFDTSVLLHNARALTAFENAHVIIPLVVLEELDHMKEELSYRGHNAREIIRILDQLRSKGFLYQGVPYDNGTTVQVLAPETQLLHPPEERPEEIDNQIIELAVKLNKKEKNVILVTRDINMRVKADVLGIEALDYSFDNVSEDTIYKGYSVLQVPAIQLKKEIPEDLVSRHRDLPYLLNEFIIVQSQNNPYNMKLFRYVGNNQFQTVQQPDLKWSLQPRNIQQRMALDLLFDSTVHMVSLIGAAGTGKTFLALVAALHEVLLYESFERVLITRPVIPLGRDIGYLPGDVGEKLHSWMQPIYDNMDYILHSAFAAQRAMGMYREEEFDHKNNGTGKHKKHKAQRNGLLPLDELIRVGKVSLEAITYMRGRSIPYQFIIIDEAQNLSAHEVKTLLSRVGEGSKVILTGDPYQIDSSSLDFSTNGLVIATDRFKGQQLFGTVFMETTERSELARLAATLL